MNENKSDKFANFDPKMVAMTIHLSHQKKGVKSAIHDQISTYGENLVENRSSRSRVLFALKFILKKEINASRTRGMHATRAI